MSAMHSAPVILRLCPSMLASFPATASGSTARSVGRKLDGRTGDRPVGAEHAAVARQGFEHFTTAFARIEEPARIRGHPFRRLVPALRTGDGGFLDHLIASGLTGEPTAPVIGMAGATNRNSKTLSDAQSSPSSLTLKISPMVMPIIGMVIQCHGWLMPPSVLFGRTSQPQVSLASAASSVRAIHSSVSKAKPGASPPGYPSQLLALKQRSIWPVRT